MSLVLNVTPLGFFRHGGKGRPGVAVTLAMAGGEIRPADAVVTGVGCRVRYEIDVSDHHDEVLWSLPSTDERMFNVRIGVGWRVCDPCEITRRMLQDGFYVLQGHLRPVVRRLSRALEVERLHDLEDQVNALVAAGRPARFPEGLEVFHLDAQVSSDDQTVSHAASIREQDRHLDIQSKEHLASMNAARSQIDLDALRRRAIETLVTGENGLLLFHLAKHPEDTMGVVNALRQHNTTAAEARSRLLEQHKDRLLPEELDSLMELLIQQTRDSIEQSGVPTLVQPHVPPSIVSGQAVSTPALPAASAENSPPKPLSTTSGTNGSSPETPPSEVPPSPRPQVPPAAGGANVAEWQPVSSDNGGRG